MVITSSYNAGTLLKVSFVSRLVVPSFQDDGFHAEQQVLLEIGGAIFPSQRLVSGWAEIFTVLGKSSDVKYGSLNVALGNS